MEDLQSLRAQIDQIDRQIAQLFCQRMAVTRQVGEYKAAHCLPVLDVAREKQVLAAKAALVGDELRADITTLFETIMALSRRQQQALVMDNGWIEGHRAAWAACRVPPPPTSGTVRRTTACCLLKTAPPGPSIRCTICWPNTEPTSWGSRSSG